MSNLIDYVETLENVKIVRTPVFTLYNIDRKKLEITSKTCSVSNIDLEFLSTIDYIKRNGYIKFHIFEISDNEARWYEQKTDLYWVRHNRVEKLKKINKNI